MRKFTKSVLIQTTALAVLSAGAFAMPAIAHAADEETAEGEEDAIVVVGTRKRDENIQEVPITITALTDQDLAERLPPAAPHPHRHGCRRQARFRLRRWPRPDRPE